MPEESLPALPLPAVMLAPDLLSVFFYFCFGTIEIAVDWVYFEAGKSIRKNLNETCPKKKLLILKKSKDLSRLSEGSRTQGTVRV